ncbi:hypothetical protein QAD02_021539 [Eretmocerus hayati]|uniref:Uncharacterized protein n=1 Tax=Eretmocerus hayati TaxID=131215 RepID=A0ACC2PQG3_9HYME|nr:hypothetical protein QAD02_021539 [Eretmocerus hayati]
MRRFVLNISKFQIAGADDKALPGTGRYLTMDEERLRKELLEMSRKLSETDAKLMLLKKKAGEAEYWASQCIDLKEQMNRFEEQLVKCFRMNFAGRVGPGSGSEEVQANSNSANSTSRSPAEQSCRAGGKKRKRDEADTSSRSPKVRKVFPLPTTIELDR